MVHAGALGLPFIGVWGLLGTDILKQRPDLKVMENPFNPGEQLVVAEPIRPLVGVFHALKADREGNAILAGKQESPTMAQASKRVVVTTEEIVDRVTPADAAANTDTFLPAADVDVVVHVPFGTHPGALPGVLEQDAVHLQGYMEAAKSPEAFLAYLERYVFGVRDHAEYLERVGIRVPAGVGA